MYDKINVYVDNVLWFSYDANKRNNEEAEFIVNADSTCNFKVRKGNFTLYIQDCEFEFSKQDDYLEIRIIRE